MLKLNVNQEKQLNFEMQIGGVQTDDIVSFLRIEIDKIEYGFPAEVKQETITVNLPALKSVVAKKLKEGDEVTVKLEVIADGQQITPWKDTFVLSYPLVVEAKIIDKESKLSPILKTKLVSSSSIVKEEKIIKPIQKPKKKIDIKNITEDDVYKYMTRAGTKNPKIQKIIYEQSIAAAKSGKPFKILQQVIKTLKKRK